MKSVNLNGEEKGGDCFSSRMLCGIGVVWHVKEVSLWREPEKRSSAWDSSALRPCAVRLVDEIPTACTARGPSAVTQTTKYLTPHSRGALQTVKAISSASSDCRGLLLQVSLYLSSPHLKTAIMCQTGEGPTEKANT